jgi:hypothetical protein
MDQSAEPTSSDNSSSPYDFIMNDGQKPGKKSGKSLPNLPKPIAITLATLFGLLILVVFYALIFGGKTTGTDQMIGVIGKANEIARVSTEVGQASHDPLTQNLAATTATALNSDSIRLSIYLKSHHTKIDAATLKTYTNKNTDAEIQVALQNNSLPAYYISYLKTSLPGYASSAKQVYTSASVTSKPILADAFNNAAVILISPPVNASSPS